MRKLAISATALALVACQQQAPAEQTTPSATPNAAPASVSPAPANAEEDIRHFLLQEFPEAAPMQYALAWRDLDGDGAKEAIVHLVTPYFCGSGGCNTLVLTQAGPMWRKVGEISVSRTPVTVLKSKTKGWSDITVDISGGGMPGGIALLKFDGEKYPGNPTVPPAESAEGHGEVLIAEEPVLTKLEGTAPSGE